MSTTTPNLGLTVPAMGDQISSTIPALGTNFQTIDNQVGTNTDFIGILSNSVTWLSVKNYGAQGDWNGSSGTDNLSAFNAAVSALPSTGGIIFVPPGDYWFSDELSIAKDNVTIFVSPGTTLRTTTQTTLGGLICFRGSGSGTTPTMKNGRVTGGGTIITVASLDNCIGFVRCDGCYVDNMVLSSGSKAITTQSYNSNIIFTDNKILAAGVTAITLETGVTNAKIDKNQIISCAKGILVSGTSAAHAVDILITGNTIYSATSDGTQVSYGDNVTIQDNNLNGVSGRGISVDNSSSIVIAENQLRQIGQVGINLAIISKGFLITDNVLDSVGTNTANTYAAISMDTVNVPFTVSHNILIGTVHKYAVLIGSSSTNQGVFMGNNFAIGQSDVSNNYNGWMPYIIRDMFGGNYVEVVNKQRRTYVSAMPTSGTWAAGDYAVNTSITEQGTAGSKYIIKGWVRITSGSVNTLNTDWLQDRALTGN